MKQLFILLLALTTLVCCNTEQKATETADNEKIVKQYFEHFNKHDWKKMADMYIDTTEFKDPTLGEGIVKQTKEQIVKKYSELGQMFPDIRDSVIHMYPSGSKHVIVEFVSGGTAPDSSRFELPICTIFTIENGLITKDFTYYDNFNE